MILTVPHSGCLASIATSDWLQKLGHALELQETDQVSADIVEIDWFSERARLASAFELVAIVTIEDTVRTAAKRRGPGDAQREDRHWEIIKVYLRRFWIPVPNFMGGGSLNDNHWFKTLDKLLECTSSTSPDQSFPVTRGAAENLVSLYIVKKKAKLRDSWISDTLDELSQDGYPCSHLEGYLVEHNRLTKRPGVEMPSNTSGTSTPTMPTRSSVAVGPTELGAVHTETTGLVASAP